MALEGIGEQVNKNVEEFLQGHGFKPRDEVDQKTLKAQIKALSDSENPVIKLMCKCLNHLLAWLFVSSL